MGLFDEVNQRFSQTGATLQGAIKTAVGSFSAQSAVMGAARAAVGKYLPGSYNAVTKALNGDLVGAGVDALRQTALGAKVNNFLNTGVFGHLLNQSFGSRLLGGLTLLEAEQLAERIADTDYARKNLFYLEITDFDPRSYGIAPPSELFNMFATAVQFSPITIAGDSKQIGSGALDGLQGRELVQLRVTTFDDVYGSIKRWMQVRSDAAVAPDGTFGLPVDYLVKVRILHAAINDETMMRFGGYEQSYIMRCAGYETDMNRGEQGLQELQLSFVQFDTFTYNQG
ncbi:hypothetical protein [Cupriavidus sp. Marseille-Q8015]